ncbi:MAG: phosphopyruvate hydratase [Proteobacteria bacterium]|nr:phosphopyruvate hydratase [Pseudomonadota bacterium]
MTEIIDVFAREILDSRGNPTIEVDVSLADGVHGRASVPSGASTGIHEAIELRDKDIKRYGGKGVLKAINGIRDIITPEISGIDATAQDLVDRMMCHLDDTENKAMLGANSILAVSLAVAKSAANSLELPLYRYLGGVQANSLPVPLCNIINGGMHVDNNLDIQEFAIAPVGLETFSEAIRASSEVYHAMRLILHEKNLSTSVVEEGGFAPDISSSKDALDLIMAAISKAGYRPGEDFLISLDCAASEFYCPDVKTYELRGENLNLNSNDLATYYDEILKQYPIFAIEDAFDQNDWNAWKAFTKRHRNIHVIGDDLFVTNAKLLQKGIEMRAANGIVIKPNQIGTLTETLDAIRTAQRNGFTTMISHRSGETEDTFIADLSVATNSRLLKTGGMSGSERIAKFNQLLRIEEELGEDACYVSKYAVRPNET